MDYNYFTDVWPRIHFAFAAGLRHNFALHDRKWNYVRLRDDTNLTVQHISQLHYRNNSMLFGTLLFNSTIRKATHCTSLEVLALSGRRLSRDAERVVIDQQHVVHMDLSCCGNAINLGESFAVFLDRFCEGSIVDTDVVMMQEFLSFWNDDVARCSRYTDQLPTGFHVTHESNSLPASSAPVSLALVPVSQPSSSSALYVPMPPLTAPTPHLEELVPFEDGLHLCKTHRPTNPVRRTDPKYWFFKAAQQGCKECVEFCVRSHHINKHVLSNSGTWNASDFAKHFHQPAMVEFIAQL